MGVEAVTRTARKESSWSFLDIGIPIIMLMAEIIITPIIFVMGRHYNLSSPANLLLVNLLHGGSTSCGWY